MSKARKLTKGAFQEEFDNESEGGKDGLAQVGSLLYERMARMGLVYLDIRTSVR